VRSLFVDNGNYFNSGACEYAITSGIFVKELDEEKVMSDEMNEHFKLVRAASEAAGYSVLAALKMFKVALPTDRYQELLG